MLVFSLFNDNETRETRGSSVKVDSLLGSCGRKKTRGSFLLNRYDAFVARLQWTKCG